MKKAFFPLIIVAIALAAPDAFADDDILSHGKEGDKYVFSIGETYLFLSRGDRINDCADIQENF